MWLLFDWFLIGAYLSLNKLILFYHDKRISQNPENSNVQEIKNY